MQITLDTETRYYLRKLRKKERGKRHSFKILVILALDAVIIAMLPCISM